MTKVGRRGVLSTLMGLPVLALLGKLSPAHARSTKVTKAPRYRGVVYDVGLNFSGDALSVEPFSPALVEYDVRAIKNDLHCNAIRIEGEVIERLVVASRIAHKVGLSVFFNPWKVNADAAELRPYYAEAAREAEKLRKEGVDIVFVAGCEYPIFQKGFIPGDTLEARLGGLGALFGGGPEAAKKKIDEMAPKLNEIFKSFVEVIRPEFKGPVTYAALSFENLDWSIFDIVGVDHYRGAETAEEYVKQWNGFRVPNKPLVCMEVGSCAYVGAAKLGGGGFMVLEGVNPDGSGKFKGGVVPTRSEREQADYVEEQVTLLADNGADGIFIYVFSFPLYPHDEGAKDLDMVAFGLVKTYPKDDPRSKKMPPWAPKEAFHRLAGLYREMNSVQSAQPRL